MRSTILALAFALLSGCAENDLPDYTKLSKLRVLAMPASAPEVSVGATVTVTPLVSDVGGGGRALAYEAVACIDPGVGLGAEPSCDHDPIAQDLGSGPVPGLDEANSFTGDAPALTVVVPPTALVGRGEADQSNGVGYVVIYTLTAADGETLTTFRRIIVSTRDAKNSNPDLVRILAGDDEFTALPSKNTELKAEAAPGSAETYSSITIDGRTVTDAEDLIFTWFYSRGKFDRYRTLEEGENEYNPPNDLQAGESTLIVVVARDGRGGEDYLRFDF